jgi:uncharacterized protein (TIGR02118 family)
MLKFVVVLYRRPDLSREAFFANLRNEHGPMAERLPGLCRYVHNDVQPDPNREHPGWDAVIELYWDDKESMEAAWKSPEGRAATEHLRTLADLSRTRWSVVEEHVRRQAMEGIESPLTPPVDRPEHSPIPPERGTIRPGAALDVSVAVL